ncbi:unnamed protein product [Cylindrotheca closterium]|uniref:Bestrophin homolog n=1 Tax=Cylindrotheca closterium TaxID=2856 RepID=A0AAD2PX29_9STRA|nr:unnamed protein product [Cylindrotheca closterium]
MWNKLDLLLACLLLLNSSGRSTAFAPISNKNKKLLQIPAKTTSTSIGVKLDFLEQKTPDDAETRRLLDSYGEKSRLYRRNVYSSADWVRSRRPKRFRNNIRTTFQSGLVRQLQPELTAIVTVSVLVVLYNDCLAVGYTDFDGVKHAGLAPFLPPLELPIIAWSLTTSALGLLLAFRTNVSYARWNEGRTAWGKVINDSRSIARMACIWSKSYKSINDESLQRLGDAICSFSRSLMNRTLPPQEDEANFVMYTYKKIKDQAYAKTLRQAKHRPTAALAELTSAIVDFQLNPLHQVEVEHAVTGLCDALGASERIFTSPIPRFYPRHTSRFLAFWLLTLPIGLYEPLNESWNHWAVIPMTVIIASMLLGIEELANQMEEPFSILPMEKMCEGSIRVSVMEQVERSQKGIQAAFCGEDSHLIDASPENIRTSVIAPENPDPHWLKESSSSSQVGLPSVVNGVNGVNGVDASAMSPEQPHWMGTADDAFAPNPNGESSYQIHAQEEEPKAADPKTEPVATTFEEYMKNRNQESLDTR